MARERPRWTLLCANVASYVQLGALHIYSSSENFLHRKLNAWARRKRWHMSYLYRFKSLLIPAAGPTLRYEGHFESPGFVWQGWVLTPPSWPCLSLPPPRLYGWMGSQGMGRKSSMWPHLPMPQQSEAFSPSLQPFLTHAWAQPSNVGLQCNLSHTYSHPTKLNFRYMPPSSNFNISMETHFLTAKGLRIPIGKVCLLG